MDHLFACCISNGVDSDSFENAANYYSEVTTQHVQKSLNLSEQTNPIVRTYSHWYMNSTPRRTSQTDGVSGGSVES